MSDGQLMKTFTIVAHGTPLKKSTCVNASRKNSSTKSPQNVTADDVPSCKKVTIVTSMKMPFVGTLVSCKELTKPLTLKRVVLGWKVVVRKCVTPLQPTRPMSNIQSARLMPWLRSHNCNAAGGPENEQHTAIH